MSTGYIEGVWYGEERCEAVYKSGKKKGQSCSNMAYWQNVEGRVLCGMHSKGMERVKLEKNPRAAAFRDEILKLEKEEIDEARKRNALNAWRGRVIVTKLRMMKKPESSPGFLKVFPNFKHKNRKDGFGCSRLSPKSLGPISHGMRGIPDALSLENYHQGAKMFAFELDEEGNLSEEALEYRRHFYEDPIPHRHKFERKQLVELGNVNIPEFSSFYDVEGIEHRYSYVECRYFYCHWYEKLVVEEEEFDELMNLLDEGTNLQIVGYDGYFIESMGNRSVGSDSAKNFPKGNSLEEGEEMIETLDACYLDTSKPFGHELVLFSMLVIEDPADYPWNRYYEENWELYAGVI